LGAYSTQIPAGWRNRVFEAGWATQLPEGLPESVQIAPSLHREYTDTGLQSASEKDTREGED
jgi:hypothetical protein